MHATILAYMFTLVEEDKITAPLFDPTKVQAASNIDYIQKYVAELLKQAFPHLQEYVDRYTQCTYMYIHVYYQEPIYY